MNTNEGKIVYANYSDAQKEAARLTKEHKRGFNVYKAVGGWMVGGEHLKKAVPYKRTKSLSDLRLLLDAFKNSEDDPAVDNFVHDVEIESTTKISIENGNANKWILMSATPKTGRELLMSNDKLYLALSLKCDDVEKTIQMGGAFEPHIPLMHKLANSLIGKPIVWHTWNSRFDKNKWSADKWFYRIEENVD